MQQTLVVLLLLISNFSFAQNTKKARQLDSIFTILYNQHQFNGTVLIAEKGKVVFEKGYGYRDEKTKKPNTPATVFELASCSKQFTAMGIVLLKKQGKLNYSDKLSRYIPELSFWEDVTIYNLLRHTSGITSYTADMCGAWDSTIIATNKDVINFYASRKDTLEFKPNTEYSYSNTNYALLASIIERVSGEDYGTFLQKNIFGPLGMKNTFVYNRRQHPRKIENYATGYFWADNSFEKVISEDPKHGEKMVRYMDGIVGSAKVNSTAEDLLKWVNALKSNTLVAREDFDEMTEVTQTTRGQSIPYGFGLDIAKGENKFSFGHTGAWDGYSTFIYQNMIKDRTIIILQNFNQGTFSFKNINEILNDQPLTPGYKKKIKLPEDDLKKYAGIYVNDSVKDEQHIISYLDGHLIYNTSATPWDMRFFPTSGNTFQAIRQGGRDGVMEFNQLKDGSTALKLSENGREIGTGIRRP